MFSKSHSSVTNNNVSLCEVVVCSGVGAGDAAAPPGQNLSLDLEKILSKFG